MSGRALDIGCGVGSTAMALAAARPDLRVTGADLSRSLVSVALSRVREDAEVRFVVGDALDVAESLAPLDLAVSRHGVMFFADPVAAFTRLHATMAPGGRLVFSCFRARRENDWAATVDAVIGTTPAPAGYAPGPFGFADPAFVRDLLDVTGWRNVNATVHDVSYVVGDDPDDALAFYRRIGPAASALAAAEDRERLEDRLRDLFAARSRNGAVAFTAGIQIWQATARGARA